MVAVACFRPDQAKDLSAPLVQGVKKERNPLQIIKIRNLNWVGHILRRNCLLKHATQGKAEGRIRFTARRRRRSKQLLDHLKETKDTGN